MTVLHLPLILWPLLWTDSCI